MRGDDRGVVQIKKMLIFDESQTPYLMLSIRCSALEQHMKQPTLFAQSLNEGIKSTASFGMFGHWQKLNQAHAYR